MSILTFNPLIVRAKPIQVSIVIKGAALENTIFADPIQVTISQNGALAKGQFIICNPIQVTLEINNRYVILSQNQSNWIMWSKIGRVDFTIDQSNVAGERPLDWSGTVYEIKKLGPDQLVVYGSNGISILKPAKVAVNKASINFGLDTINKLGIICKSAVIGDESTHFFIENGSCKLYSLSTKGMELLDYSEFLSQLVNPVMSIDHLTGLLYICDGLQGFVYSTLFQSFGTGPSSISGMGVSDGKLHVTSPSTKIPPPSFDICTDIYDFNSRKPKTIQYIELGAGLSTRLQIRVESRIKNNEDFRTTQWQNVGPDGIATVPCYGVEFKFHIRSLIYELFHFDYIKVTGAMHGFDSLNSVQ